MSTLSTPFASPAVAANFRYYDFVRHWTKRIEPHLADKKLNDILVQNFNKFTYGRWEKTFTYGDLPYKFESCDWWTQHRGKEPRYWRYVKHAAAHWLVNFNLRLAMLAEPKHVWRIVTSQKHSTVWNGENLLFDMTFSALGVDANEAWELARQHGRVLPAGKCMPVYYAEHYSVDVERNRLQLGIPAPAEQQAQAPLEEFGGEKATDGCKTPPGD